MSVAVMALFDPDTRVFGEKGFPSWSVIKCVSNSVLTKQGFLWDYLSSRFWVYFSSLFSGQVRPRQGTEICNFGAPSPLEALHWIFCFFSSIYVQFSKTSPLKSGESSEKSSGENRVKSCHVCGCHGFFGPDFSVSGENWSLNGHLRANFGLKWAVKLPKPKPELK